MTVKIAFVGGGTMATAILSSAGIGIRWKPSEICVAEPVAETRKRHEKAGHLTCEKPEDLPKAGAYFLCVKPQDMAEACASLAKSNDFKDQAVISIMAGVSVATLKKSLGGGQVIRAMPNTPVLVNMGCTFAHGPDGQDTDAACLAREAFSSMGDYHWVADETLIDVATALSGSGPAYAYLVIEAMANKASELGLDSDVALKATLATLQGACGMVMATKEDPASLRKKVTSKGGTTEAALQVLADKGFADALSEAIEAAKDRAVSLSGK